MAGWEEGAASVEVSSGGCFEGITASLSSSICLLSFTAVRKQNSRELCEYEELPIHCDIIQRVTKYTNVLKVK